MTCKDCVHEEICDMPIITDERKNADNCGKFKNKADYVEVVRCDKCKEYTRYEKALGWCYMHNALVFHNNFCSYGERK